MSTYFANNLEISVNKCGVGKSVAEGEERSNVLVVVPSVPYQQLFRIYAKSQESDR
jgi:hypothetical protein